MLRKRLPVQLPGQAVVNCVQQLVEQSSCCTGPLLFQAFLIYTRQPRACIISILLHASSATGRGHGGCSSCLHATQNRKQDLSS